MTTAESVGHDRQLLVVGVGQHRVALRVRDVVEVLPMVHVDPLPGAPPVVEGVIDVRGVVVPVLDLRRRFGRDARPPQLHDHLVVVDVDGRRLALHVGAAADLHDVDLGALDHEPPTEAGPGAAGVVRLPDGLVVIHDIAAFLSSDEVVALDAALEDAS